jgi:uncharacterized membrane protein YhaH (DUF805 family)
MLLQSGLLRELFSYKGRVSAQRYNRLFYYSLGIMVAPIFAVIIFGAIINVLAGPDFIRNSPVMNGVVATIVGAGLFVGAWSRSAIQTKRAHDVGRSGWWLPYWFWTPLGEGNPGPNKYGAQPWEARESSTIWESGWQDPDEED